MVEFLTSTDKAKQVGTKIGNAMARDHKADCLPIGFCLSAEDGDQLTDAGIFPGSPEWNQAVDAAKDAYDLATATAAKRADGLDNPCSTNSGSVTWGDVCQACEDSDAVRSYDDTDDFEIEWCDGSKERFSDPLEAYNAIQAMEAN